MLKNESETIFHEGDWVYAPKLGTGKVDKVNLKNIKVTFVDGKTYSCPKRMLSQAEAPPAADQTKVDQVQDQRSEFKRKREDAAKKEREAARNKMKEANVGDVVEFEKKSGCITVACITGKRVTKADVWCDDNEKYRVSMDACTVIKMNDVSAKRRQEAMGVVERFVGSQSFLELDKERQDGTKRSLCARRHCHSILIRSVNKEGLFGELEDECDSLTRDVWGCTKEPEPDAKRPRTALESVGRMEGQFAALMALQPQLGQ